MTNVSLDTKSRHNDKFVVIFGTADCHNDNPRWHRRRQIWHHGHSRYPFDAQFMIMIFVFTPLVKLTTVPFGEFQRHSWRKNSKQHVPGIRSKPVEIRVLITLQWRHDERYDISNHQPPDCLLNGLFRCRSTKISKLRVTGLCEGNSPVNSPHKGSVTRTMFPFDDVIMIIIFFHSICIDINKRIQYARYSYKMEKK